MRVFSVESFDKVVPKVIVLEYLADSLPTLGQEKLSARGIIHHALDFLDNNSVLLAGVGSLSSYGGMVLGLKSAI